jgi:hypothetical protein
MSATKSTAAIAPTLIMNKIKNGFDALGKKNGTAAPQSANNLESIAWDYHVASELSRMAEARKRSATAAAVKAGVLIDPATEPRDPGTNEILFSGEHVQVQVSVRSPTTSYNIDAISSSLVRQGVSTDVVTNAIIDGTRQNRAPHTFKTIVLSPKQETEF